MSARKGVGGREVPGATLASHDGPTKAGYGKNKKKKDKKRAAATATTTTHTRTLSVVETVQSDDTLVDEVKTPPEDVFVRTGSEEKGWVEVGADGLSNGVVEDWNGENKRVKGDVNGHQLPRLIIPDRTKHDHDVENGWGERVSNGVPDNASTQRTTPSEWEDTVIGDILTRTTATGTQHATPHTDTKRRAIQDWFETQTKTVYHNLSTPHREKIINHLYHIKYTPTYNEEWNRELRLTIWRAVVRANFFWTYNGVPTGKAKPIQRPVGAFENHFEAFVQCAAERLDRIQRDLPDPEYVKKIEDEVRGFLSKAEEKGMHKQLKHLAFLLMFEEEQGKSSKAALTLEEMQERIRRGFVDVNLGREEFEVMRKGKKPAVPALAGHTVVVADVIWNDAVSKM